jgi:shikimate dehydrogenase
MSDRSEPLLAAVVGHPVDHSLSPRIFAYLSRRLRHPLLYKKLDVGPAEFAGLFKAVARTGLFIGWNVTIPHKQAAMKLVERIAPEAQRVGAANVVVFTARGAEAHNTDVFGVSMTLAECRFDPSDGISLIYGAGGAARAVACSLGQSGARDVLVCNRTARRARGLCQDMERWFPNTSFQTIQRPCDLQSPVKLVVNATSVGLKGNAARWHYPPMLPGALALDLIYGAKPTAFLRGASRRKAQTIDGRDMLIWQALATWQIWFGEIDRPRALKRALKLHLQEAE